MKMITRDSDYAIRALAFIAKNGGKVVSAAELARRMKMPQPFLRKILQVLNREGLLKSRKGVGGGFQLARAPDKIFLVNIVEAFQGRITLNECFFKKSLCPNRNSCILKKKIDKLEGHLLSELRTIAISDLINP